MQEEDVKGREENVKQHNRKIRPNPLTLLALLNILLLLSLEYIVSPNGKDFDTFIGMMFLIGITVISIILNIFLKIVIKDYDEMRSVQWLISLIFGIIMLWLSYTFFL